MQDCLFCRIVRGEIPAAIVHEDEWVLAFKDIQPQRPVHVLVIPKKHITSLAEATEADTEAATEADSEAATDSDSEAATDSEGSEAVTLATSSCPP